MLLDVIWIKSLFFDKDSLKVVNTRLVSILGSLLFDGFFELACKLFDSKCRLKFLSLDGLLDS
jgi:hypothetical protein